MLAHVFLTSVISTFCPLIITILTVLVAVLGDRLLMKNDYLVSRALIDSITHGSIGLLSWAIIVFSNVKGVSDKNLFEIVSCGLIASLIDIDHFIAARSFKLKGALSLTNRPFLHSSTLVILVFISFCVLAEVLNTKFLQRIGWIILVAVVSHHIRDGSRRGLWFPPFGSTLPIPYWVYLVLTAVLPYLVVIFMPSERFSKNHRYIIV